MRLRIFCRIFRIVRVILCRIVRLIVACRCRFILHAARQDILFGYFVLECRFRNFTRFQFGLVKLCRDVFSFVAFNFTC